MEIRPPFGSLDGWHIGSTLISEKNSRGMGGASLRGQSFPAADWEQVIFIIARFVKMSIKFCLKIYFWIYSTK